ncbi:deoxycytidylate deaminase-like [Panonychus citri]|uniref:deoxycytidylate deaminase-like n=1 Tax=Panonychus citri TaxID=50023 RepID=UPI002307BF76|nr:deoxycytidylate deaminase-like [Panonychus citri]
MNDESSTKRADYLDWDEYFMATAHLASLRSKDPVTQVGTCIVNTEKKIVGIGYNGMPTGCNDDLMPWTKNGDTPLDNKHLYVCHAEMNAIANRNSADVKNCSLYTTLFPCNECAKLIIQSGIREVIYCNIKSPEKTQNKASKRMLDMVNIIQRKFNPKRNEIIIDFTGKK